MGHTGLSRDVLGRKSGAEPEGRPPNRASGSVVAEAVAVLEVRQVGTLEQGYNTTTLVNELFDLLGDYTVCAHAKDIQWLSTLTVRFDEVPIGEGVMDQVTFLRRFEGCRPDGWVLIEHLPDELIPAAKIALDQAAVQAGLRWRE